MMLLFSLLVYALGLVNAKDSSKAIKSMPAITNSFVNLGKIDIAYHFNSKAPEPANTDSLYQSYSSLFPSFQYSKPKPLEDECPCSSFKGMKDSFASNPSALLNKLLMSNDLFNKDLTSSFCCDSHEHVQEDTIFFEIGPKPSQRNLSPYSNAASNFIFEDYSKKPMFSPFMPKSKAIDIFLFPKRKDILTSDFKKALPKKNNVAKKEGIQIVGDKELRKDFKNYGFRPAFPVIPLIKTGLSLNEKKETTVNEKEVTATTSAANAL